LAMVGILGSMIFAGVSGSAVATTAAMGSILIPPMEEKKYHRGYAASVIATAGTIGPIIPPSIPMVIYGSITGASIGKLFVGGYIPGLMIGAALMTIAYCIAKKRNYPKNSAKISGREIIRSTLDALLSLFMPFIIIGGILLGVFTPTEAGAVACVYAYILGQFVYKEITLQGLYQVMENGVQITTIVMFLVAVASLFGWILTVEGLPMVMAEFFLGISRNPLVILLMLNVFLLIVGMFMDCTPAIILLMPVLFPLLQEVGIDLIHFGVIMVVNLGIGLVTPPVGTCLFVAGNIAKISIVEIVKEVWPFLIGMLVILMFITYVPQAVTWLPSVLM
ncbi:MAG: TRAP transporter large permease, partial [Deltaproteobacteria bacterium]|nr:TRAP transporter large permease [Deltaproteobacteria bacterium]